MFWELLLFAVFNVASFLIGVTAGAQKQRDIHSVAVKDVNRRMVHMQVEIDRLIAETSVADDVRDG